MATEKSSLSRREAIQRLAIGLGAVVSACGSSNGNNAATATAAPTQTRTPSPSGVLPTATTTPVSIPTSTLSPTGAPSPTASLTQAPSSTPTVTPEQISCVLTPQQTLGPFFLDVGLARSDIREDRDGTQLRLVVQLVDADGCSPIQGAVVNVWHADAAGAYSGFAGQPGGVDTTGETFLRGFQMTDADGRVEFITIYPGWYTGRTVHIHVRIHLDATTVLVSQLYFPDSLTDVVFTEAPYSSRPNRSTTNETDGIAAAGIDDLLLDLAEENGGYVGSIVLGAAL